MLSGVGRMSRVVRLTSRTEEEAHLESMRGPSIRLPWLLLLLLNALPLPLPLPLLLRSALENSELQLLSPLPPLGWLSWLTGIPAAFENGLVKFIVQASYMYMNPTWVGR